MKLSYLFSDGMVLQRNKSNHIWGMTEPLSAVSGVFGGKMFQTKADRQGNFSVELPNLPAGGPYCMELHGDEDIVIRDILVGDVFLLGGQSNMELRVNRVRERFGKELDEIHDSKIRKFDVPKEYAFDAPQEWLSAGCWCKAEGNDVFDFSAAGIFMALALREKKDIPIGLIQTAVEGSPAKAWCSEATIREMGFYTEELEQCKDPDYVQKIQEEEDRHERHWMAEAETTFDEKNTASMEIQLPRIWREEAYQDFCGLIYLEKRFYVTEEQAKLPAELLLGAVIDYDRVSINGKFCGGFGDKYVPRIYPIPTGVFIPGENIIQVKMYTFRGNGGFMLGKAYGIRFQGDRAPWIELAGTWEAKFGKKMECLPERTFFNYMAAGLYQGMLCPISRYQICGVLYYQGESDTGHPQRYAEEFRALISDWRKLWMDESLPFIYVQLAGFSDGVREAQGISWAEFRETQKKAATVSNTVMVQAHDLGEYNDLHPSDKKTVGRRLALGVRKMVYKENVSCTGPQVRKIWLDEENRVHAVFDQKIRRDTRRLEEELQGERENDRSEVELRTEKGDYVRACTKVEEGTLLAWLPDGIFPAGIRYAWRDCPIYVDLYGEDGLPVIPFVEEWGQDEISIQKNHQKNR